MKRRTKLMLLALLFVAVFFTSALITVRLTGSAPNRLLEVDYSGQVYHDLRYENDYGHCYDLYLPEDSLDGRAQYLILFIHGGSFNSSAKEDGEAWCRYYAKQGYVAATLDYSLQTVHEDATLHRMNDEIGGCVLAVKEKCSELGISLEGMATCGVSAGGTLAMNYAYTAAERSSVPVKFVFQLAGPTDFEPSDWTLLKKVNGLETDGEFLKMMTGQDFSETDIASGRHSEAVEAISPARLVRDGSVPTLCGYGLRDYVVPPDQKELLLAALNAHGVPYDYLEFPNSNHGLYADLDILRQFLDLALVYCDRYFQG